MRKIDCSIIERPSCLDFDVKTSLATKELKNVLEQRKKGDSKVTFKVYKNVEVKYSLEKLFLGKCAYCETNYSVTQPVDIEHFRPKGRVKVGGTAVHEGYYWLAACWENLLPSCIDCNRVRKVGFILPSGLTKKGKTGKGEQFELVDENKRILKLNTRIKASNLNVSNSIVGEHALLLNPRFDAVERYFDYTDEGVIILSSNVTSDIEKKRAQSSIQTYGLNRVGLVFARKQIIILIDNYVFMLRRLLKYADEESSIKHRIMLEDFAIYVTKFIRTFLTDDKPYCGMSRKIVKSRLKGVVDI